MSRYIFKCIDEVPYSTVKGKEVLVEFSGELNRDQILEEFKGFLQAAGFTFNIDDRLDVVNDTEDYERLFDEDPEDNDVLALNQNQLNFDNYINIPFPHHLNTTVAPGVVSTSYTGFGNTMNAGPYSFGADILTTSLSTYKVGKPGAAAVEEGSLTLTDCLGEFSFSEPLDFTTTQGTLDLSEGNHITLDLTDSFETKDKLG